MNLNFDSPNISWWDGITPPQYSITELPLSISDMCTTLTKAVTDGLYFDTVPQVILRKILMGKTEYIYAYILKNTMRYPVVRINNIADRSPEMKEAAYSMIFREAKNAIMSDPSCPELIVIEEQNDATIS